MSYTFTLTDIATEDELVDLTEIADSKTLSPRLNKPFAVQLTDMAADNAELQAIYDDGDPVLWPASRGIKVKLDGDLIAHARVETLSFTGATENDQKILATALDPMARFPTRQVIDNEGRIADPVFPSPIDAGTMLKTAIDNSADPTIGDDNVIVDPTTGLPVTPLIFPVDTSTGLFTTSEDMGELFTDGPQTIGDLVTELTKTGAVDVYLRPVDSSMGYTPGIMAELNVVPQWGSDLTATVHFDYATGSKNVSSARRIIDASTLGNKLTYELGPKVSKDHWHGNIVATDVSELGTSYLHQSLVSRAKYGVHHQTRVYDTDNDNASRPLYLALWKLEATLRRKPRDQLYLTPVAPGTSFTPAFEPFVDYGLGDIVAVNTGAVLGKPLSNAAQRIFGFDVTIDRNGVVRAGELICSADAE